MKMKCLVLAVAIGLCVGTNVERHAEPSPVERVVIMLKALHHNLITDQKVEQQIYDKYACWCEATTKRKAQAIDDAQDAMDTALTGIQTATSAKAVAEMKIEKFEQLIADGKASQESRENIRQKQNKNFMAESSEAMQALKALEGAIKTLHAGVSFLEKNTAVSTIREVVNVMPVSLALSPEKVSLLSEFSKSGSAYAPQSATVQGILKDLYDTFAANLQKDSAAEASRQFEFEVGTANNARTAAFFTRKIGDAKQDLVDAEEALEMHQDAYTDAKEEQEAAIKFFEETEKACLDKHKEWTIVKELRDDEIKGVVEALEILTAPENRKLFHSSIKDGMETVSFLQTDESTAATFAAEALSRKATKLQSLRLASLSADLRMAKAGHFDKVLKAIADMRETLEKEQAQDLKDRDECVEDLHQIDLKRDELEFKMKNNRIEIASDTADIKETNEKIAANLATIKETEETIKQITQEREDEHKAFKAAKEEDETAIGVLEQVIEKLEEYYKKNDIKMGKVQEDVKAALVQEPEFEVSADQAPDAVFSHKGRRKGESKNAISMLTMIKEDLQDEIKQSKINEAEALTAYEEQKKSLEDQIAALKSTNKDLEKLKNELKKHRDAEKKDLQRNDKADTAQKKEFLKISPDCTWIINSYTERSARRTQEMDGLREAREYLTGYQPPALLDTSVKFDDNAFGEVHFENID